MCCTTILDDVHKELGKGKISSERRITVQCCHVKTAEQCFQYLVELEYNGLLLPLYMYGILGIQNKRSYPVPKMSVLVDTSPKVSQSLNTM